MSKADITAVATLAAHLQRKCDDWQGEDFDPDHTPEKCAADAMQLQRLGRSVRNSHKKAGQVSYDHTGACIRIRARADAVLKPYGLTCATRLGTLMIHGLPGNTPEEKDFSI